MRADMGTSRFGNDPNLYKDSAEFNQANSDITVSLPEPRKPSKTCVGKAAGGGCKKAKYFR
jgi:hypothetical protein